MPEANDDRESVGSRTNAAGASEAPDGDECVRWAYRLLLGREPENPAAIQNNPHRYDRQRLVQSMLNSEEFRQSNLYLLPDLAKDDLTAEADTRKIEADIAEALDNRFDTAALVYGYECLDRTERACVLAYLHGRFPTAFTRPWEQQPRPEAMQADIVGLFRLILGRTPSGRLEWLGHVEHLGERLTDVTRRYLTSLEFERRGLLQPPAPKSIEATSLEGFSIYAARDDSATGVHILAGAYEPHVTAVFRRHLRAGMNVVDIGANVGYFTMLAASIVGPEGTVWAVEANPDNAKLIEASRRLNGFRQIRIANVAAGREMGILSLNTDYSNGVTAEIATGEGLWAARTVPCVPLRQLIPQDRRIDFIKIDVEGAEYLALLGLEEILRRDRPIIVSEFSPDALPGISGISAEGYLRFLVGCGLALAVIRPDAQVEKFDSDVSGVMRAWAAASRDHIDIMAAPPPET